MLILWLEMIEVRKNQQTFERQAKEERTRLLNELSTLRHRLGEEKGRNEVIEKVCCFILGRFDHMCLQSIDGGDQSA